MSVYCLAKNIRVCSANAMSSSYTVGFPAITAWLGGVRAIERKLKTDGIKFTGVAIVSNDFEMQTHKHQRENHAHIKGVLFTPDVENGKPKPASFIHQATCHVIVSLLIETEGIDNKAQADALGYEIKELLLQNPLAGGTVTQVEAVEFLDDDENERSILRKLMPGYLIIERRDLLKGGDPLKKMMDVISVEASYNGEGWEYKRKMSGWIVPIAVGFKAVSDFVSAKNSRAPNVKHRFVEPVVTLGEFKMPHRFKRIEDIMWRYRADEKNGLYLCVNQI